MNTEPRLPALDPMIFEFFGPQSPIVIGENSTAAAQKFAFRISQCDVETVTAFDTALINTFSFGAPIAEGECEQLVYFFIKRESQRCNNRPRAETRGGLL